MECFPDFFLNNLNHAGGGGSVKQLISKGPLI